MGQSLLKLVKEIYLLGVKTVSKVRTKKHHKIVFLLSFPSTSDSILEALHTRFDTNMIICYSKNSRDLAMLYREKGCEVYPLDNYFLLLKKIIPKIKSANVILCDNYYAFLSAISFEENVKVVQLWHANGAIKKFGLEAEYAISSSINDKKRYKKVYKKFTNYVVSSEKMAKVFSANYHQSIKALNFGYHQTDFYMDEDWILKSKKKIKQVLGDKKKILLYAPTYREKEELFIPLSSLKQLSKDWLVIAKLHPHDAFNQEYFNEEDIITNLKDIKLRELLPSVDCLITDYSSIPFEYSIANPNGKMVFYCYDFEEYINNVGLESSFFKSIPGIFVKEEKKLISAVNSKSFSSLKQFNQEWNQYVKGTAREQLVNWVEEYNE